MTATRRTPRPEFVQAQLARLGLNVWSFIQVCSRADRCSVNVCPLDPLVALRSVDPLDREKRCTVSKPDRERFFSRLRPDMQALLPFGGLLESEWNRREASRRLASMSPEQRARMQAGREKGMAALKEARLKALSKSTGVGSAPDTSGADGTAKAGANGGEAA